MIVDIYSDSGSRGVESNRRLSGQVFEMPTGPHDDFNFLLCSDIKKLLKSISGSLPTVLLVGPV